MFGSRTGVARWVIFAALAIAAPAPSDAADGELHTFHCLFGCPLWAPATDAALCSNCTNCSSDVIACEG